MSKGRPTVFSKTALQKLEEIFALGGSDKEACFYANIAPASLYNYQTSHPDFLERKELLKEQPILKVRRSVIAAIEKDPRLALMYLERKRREEFSTKYVARIEVADNRASVNNSEAKQALDAIGKEYEAKVREVYAAT